MRWPGSAARAARSGSTRAALPSAATAPHGTLAAALAIEARANGNLPQPVLQVLAYPGLSSRQTSASYERYGSGHLLERSTVDWFFRQYLRDDSDRDDWRFAPLAANDLSGLAPAFIVLAEFDPLVDEGATMRHASARLAFRSTCASIRA